MKKSYLSKVGFAFATILFLLFYCSSTIFAQPSTNKPQANVQTLSSLKPNGVLVKFKDEVSGNQIQAFKKQYALKTTSKVDQLNVEELKAPNQNTTQLVSNLAQDQRVAYAEPNYPVAAELIPNDPLYLPYQWNLPKIKAPEAWDIETGKSSTVIAVIDTGVDRTHPELGGKVLPSGYDFVNNDSDPSDDNGHGTYVAGIATAQTNNSIGLAGVSWDSKILPMKALDADGYGYYDDVAKAIILAARLRARIINLSMAGLFPSRTLQNAINFAYSRGCVITAAGGNSGNVYIYYPAGCKHVIGVAATDQNDNRAWFSNYNASIDVAAPGVDITSTWLSSVSPYATASGTSASAPHVSGLAALILSRRPSYSASKVETTIETSADDLGPLGRDNQFGYGRINAQRALLSTSLSPTKH